MYRLLPDLDACWAVLPPDDRAAVERFEGVMGLPRGGWRACAPLRDVVTVCAMRLLAADIHAAAGETLGELDALAEACEALGLEDDSDLNTRPSDSVARRLRRWQRNAVDMDVHSPRGDAA